MSRRQRNEGSCGLPETTKVIMDLDGGIDDFVALVFLLSAQFNPRCYAAGTRSSMSNAPSSIRVIGVTVVEADCYAEPCVDVCRRLLALYAAAADQSKDGGTSATADDFLTVPVACSSLKGAFAPFPEEFRRDSYNLSDMPILNTPAVNDMLAKRKPSHNDSDGLCGHKLLADLVLDCDDDEVTLVVTGPLTNVAWAIREHGDRFAKKIHKLLWMGGAVGDVDGNVYNKNLPAEFQRPAWEKKAAAEWNVAWDSSAAKTVFAAPALAGGKIVVVPLNATNQVPVLQPFVRQFAQITTASSSMMPTAVAQFVGGAWSLVTYVSRWAGASYYAWDVLTSAVLLVPDVVKKIVPAHIHIVDTRGSDDEGQMVMTQQTASNSNKINAMVLLEVNPDIFYRSALNAARVF